jgi:hypothetical protein
MNSNLALRLHRMGRLDSEENLWLGDGRILRLVPTSRKKKVR